MEYNFRTAIGRATLLCCTLFSVLQVQGQNITGSIVGFVSDTSGAATPGAVITVVNQGTGTTVEAKVDEQGSYTVPNLLAGTYRITAKKEGFQTIEARDIQLLSAQSVRQNFTLQPGTLQQTIEVTSSAPLIHTDTQTIGGSLGQHASIGITARDSLDRRLTYTCPRSIDRPETIHAFREAITGAATTSR